MHVAIMISRVAKVMAMNVREMMSREYKKAEHYLLYYEAEQKKYAEDLAEFLTKEKSEVGGSRGGVGDPTGIQAVKRVEFERKSEAYVWLDAVRAVESVLTDAERMIVKCRRDFSASKYRRQGRGRPPWIVNVVARFASEKDKVVSDFTIRKLWSNMLRMVVFAANKRKW